MSIIELHHRNPFVIKDVIPKVCGPWSMPLDSANINYEFFLNLWNITIVPTATVPSNTAVAIAPGVNDFYSRINKNECLGLILVNKSHIMADDDLPSLSRPLHRHTIISHHSLSAIVWHGPTPPDHHQAMILWGLAPSWHMQVSCHLKWSPQGWRFVINFLDPG